MFDLQGREYAHYDDLKVGDLLVVDDDFTCMSGWSVKELFEDEDGFYVHCDQGRHYLVEEEDGYIVGMYHPKHITVYFR